MAKFYIVNDETGATIDCFTKGADAIYACRDGYEIVQVDVPVSAKSIRLLLAGHGGYAKKVCTLYPNKNLLTDKKP